MFESTLPFGTPDLIRVSAFRRYLDETARASDGDVGTSRLSQLNPSLAEDLMRFDEAGRSGGLELLEVMAACVRHSRSLLLQLQSAERVLPLTVFPSERLVHCPLQIDLLLGSRLTELRVLHVEPAVLRPPGHPEISLVADRDEYAPIGPLLWELAMRGARDALLPEIAGSAAYRITPGLDLFGLSLSGSMAAAVERMKRQTSNLREIAEWPGFDRERAQRLLNGLYLQAGLMVSRTHPSAKA